MSLTRLYGIHAAQAALDYSAAKIRRGWADVQRHDKRLKKLVVELTDLGIGVEVVDRKKLDRMAEGKNHQGIVIEIELPQMLGEERLKQVMAGLDEMPLLLVLDQVQDPHNLGACLRSAAAAGAHGVIVTKDNAAGITPTVCKVASGAAETVPVYQVTNLARTLRWLKDAGVWVAGASGKADSTIYQSDLNRPLAIVMGAEGSGMRQLTEKHCDFLLKIPMTGRVESLNVSVAAGILLYEAYRQRL